MAAIRATVCEEGLSGLIARPCPHADGGVDDVELATLGRVHWFNNERLHGTLDDIPPVEFEAAYHQQQETSHLVGKPMN